MAALAERLRRAVRALIGRTPLYPLLSRGADFVAVVRNDGLGTWSTLARLRRGRGAATEIRLRKLRHPLLVRASEEDVTTVMNTIERDEWGQLPGDFDPRTMIDAGAYIGDTAAYFLSRFPNLRVTALEPDPDNYALAAKNLAPYGDRVTLLDAGLWSSDGQLGMSGTFTSATIDRSGTGVKVVSMHTLLDGIDRIDIVKMDIEGAEAEVFRDAAWLTRTELVVLEIHGDEAMRVVREALERHAFTMRRFRSVWYCRR